MSVLLVDGDNLLTIGFYGLKNHFYKGRHIGGLYHFINTLKRFINEHRLDKVVVFWDGEDGAYHRKKISHHYKAHRKNRFKTEAEESDYNRQRIRIKQYLEELYIRQGEYYHCEADDNIAYYVHTTNEKKIIIYSSDGDLPQLLNDDVSIYNPSHRKLYTKGSIITYQHEDILIENVKLAKILCGDYSDNIYGIWSLGIKTFVKLYPEVRTTELSVEDILEKSNLLFEENKDNKTIQNVLTGVSKLGVFGDEFYKINQELIDLSNPLLTDEARTEINDLIYEKMDTEGRSYKNTMKMMMEDGIFLLLPKRDDAWLNFLSPFLKLTRKEKNKHRFKRHK